MNVTITGEPEGHAASVSPQGRLSADTVAVEATYAVVTSNVAVGIASTLLAGARAGRRAVWIQNQGANVVCVRFDSTAAAATDWNVPAGGEFRAESMPYEGEIYAIALVAPSAVLVLEMV